MSLSEQAFKWGDSSETVFIFSKLRKTKSESVVDSSICGHFQNAFKPVQEVCYYLAFEIVWILVCVAA